jgi:menaquinol-cytochrome c reductase cytochrome b/c subunit
MNEQEKKDYLEKYEKIKKQGVPFFPDTLVKDALIALVVFLLLVVLSFLLGAPLEARANPTDTTYIPRPEWYFLFLYQLLKYFPGNLEVVGVVIIPLVVIVLLFLLPLLDKKPQRYFTNRPIVTGITILFVIGIVGLTILALGERPPTTEVVTGDNVAALYLKNCAGCHGESINVTSGTNLHEIIAQGTHTGMPAWNADLTTDQIDALAGFIMRPEGNKLFMTYCGDCHNSLENIVGEPINIKNALDLGKEFPEHTGQDVPDFSQIMTKEEQSTLLNFLVAPDGQRLYAINCSSCHGNQITLTSSESELRSTIMDGGKHLDMPAWGNKLASSELDVLAAYVVDPSSNPAGKDLYEQNCKKCHQSRLPNVTNYDQARKIISGGGVHETMPVWGNILTSEQIDALVKFIIENAQGTSTEIGQTLLIKVTSFRPSAQPNTLKLGIMKLSRLSSPRVNLVMECLLLGQLMADL